MSRAEDAGARSAAGVGFALAAFGLWGANPVYFKAVDHISALEILAHRVVWTVVMLAVLISLTSGWRPVAEALRDRRTLGLLALSTLLISVNWLIYIWAIAAERVLETSLGYFINPLVSVLLGVVVLRERLSALQGVAVLLAAAGVANLALGAVGLPWVALSLAVTFGLYGLIRKTVRIGSVDGLFAETAALLPAALVYLWLFGSAGHFLAGSTADTLLLLASGLVTATPLLLFTSAARRLRLSTIGMFQYLAPSCQFLLAVFVYGEAFTQSHLWTFLCIWTALAVFTLDSLRTARRDRAAAQPAGAE